ncbi:hypothetical protein Aros01_07079 [Streptosporangium roseum]
MLHILRAWSEEPPAPAGATGRAAAPADPAAGEGGPAGGTGGPANGSRWRTRSAGSVQEADGACGSGANRSTPLPSGSRTSA